MSDWLGTGSSGSSTSSSHHSGNSSLWPDFLSNNPLSEGVGHAGDWIGRGLRSNPVTGIPTTFIAGPHQLVDFATHDWIAGLYALGKLAYHQQLRHGLTGFLKETAALPAAGPLFAPLLAGHDTPSQLVHDKGTLFGGAVVPMGEAYKQKYLSSDVGHHIAQDPFGTVLDALVIGKLAGAAHLASVERAAAAGKIDPESRLARVLDQNPRSYRIHPSPDRYGNSYGAEGVQITKGYRAATTQGRLLQSYIDDLRLRLPEGLPFSMHRLAFGEKLRQVQQVFHRNAYKIKTAAVLIDRLPEGLKYAVQHVAELPRDLTTGGAEPIGRLLSRMSDALDEARQFHVATPHNSLANDRVAALEHRVEVLKRIHDVRDAIYNPEHPDHARFMEAYQAARAADQSIKRELLRRGLVTQEQMDAKDVLVHRLVDQIRPARYTPEGVQTDALGSFEGMNGMAGLTTEEALARQDAALGLPPRALSDAEARSAAFDRISSRLADNLKEQELAKQAMRQAAGLGDEMGVRRQTKALEELDKEATGIQQEIDRHHMANEVDQRVQEMLRQGVEPGPLAQYGPSWAWPHEAFAVVGAPTGILRDLASRVLTGEPRSLAMADWAKALEGKGAGWTWLEGLINSHPETLTTAQLYKWADIRARDFVDRFLYPMSGQLMAGEHYVNGKLSNEGYVLAPVDRAAEPLTIGKRTYKTVQELFASNQQLRPKRLAGGKTESEADWLQRMADHGVRRVKLRYIKKFERETDTARTLFQRIVHGGLNQVWRYMLLAIKPAWALANTYTNEALVMLKNAGRGGLRAFISLAADANKRNLYKLAQYTKRMSLSRQTRFEVNQLLQEKMGVSIHDAIHQDLPEVHAATLGRSRFFQPPRAGREVPVDAVSPEGKFFEKWATSPGFMSRRSLHILGAPARLVEAINRHGEEFARDQAVLAKAFQMTGKMAHSGPEFQKIMRETGLGRKPELRTELIVGRNGPIDALGDYSRMTASEREWVTAAMPFYAWYKTILGITAKFVARDPERLWVLHALANGIATVAAQDMQLGVPVPSFAKDLLPVFGPQNKGQYQLALGTRTWNPFQTPIDIGRNVASVISPGSAETSTPNDVGLGLFGPAFQAGYTFFTGRDPFYGGAYRGWGSGQGRVGQTLGSFVYGFPQKRLYDQSTGGYKSKVFEAPSQRDQLYVGWLQYLGIPVKYAHLPDLQTRAQEEGTAPPPAAPAQHHSSSWLGTP